MNRKLLVPAALLAALLAWPAYADLDEIRALLQSGDTRAAADKLEPLAASGDTEAMVLLGDLYYEGTGIARNFSLAWSWYNRAAHAGNSDGQYKTGRMLWNGEGVPTNEHAALEQYEAAAAQGHDQAQLEAGLIYRDGRRQISKSAVKALDYLKRSAAQGNFEAELALEEMFDRGLAPREELEQFRSEQALRSMSEAERLRAAISSWIETIESQYTGTAIGPRPEVLVTETATGFEVSIPDLTLTPAAGQSIRFGTVAMTLVPVAGGEWGSGEDVMAQRRYELRMTPPRRIEIQSGPELHVLTYDADEITGEWMPALLNFVRLDASLHNLMLTDSMDATVFRAARAGWVVALDETEPGVWGGPSRFELEGLSVDDPAGGAFTVARIAALNELTGIRLETYSRLMNKANNDPAALLEAMMDPESGSDLIDAMLTLVAASHFSMEAQSMAYVDGAGHAQFSLDQIGLGMEGARVAANDGSFSLTYKHGGLMIPAAGAEAALLPRDAALTLSAGRIPIEALARGLVEMMGSALIETARHGTDNAPPPEVTMVAVQGRLLQALFDAGTTLDVDLGLVSEAAGIDLTGQVAANANAFHGVSGAFDLGIRGLDALLARAGEDPGLAGYQNLLSALAATAKTETGADGQALATFEITVAEDGAILINGEDALAISSGALVPQEGQAPQQGQAPGPAQ